MAVLSATAEDVTAAANHDPAGAGDVVDLRTSTDVKAGALAGPRLSGDGMARHPYHQVEYTLEGVAEVETTAGHFLLPPQQAIWIPAGLVHNTTLQGVRSVSVFFHPGLFPGSFDRARVLAAAPVVREMMRYAVRWPITRSPSSIDGDIDEGADVFFAALARLVLEWLDERSRCGCRCRRIARVAVMHHTNEHLATVMVARLPGGGRVRPDAAPALRAGDGDDVEAYLHQARLIRAMALLGATGGC